MILNNIKDYFIDNALTQGLTYYTGIAPPNADLPYVVCVPKELTTEYLMNAGNPRPCIDTMDFEFHLYHRSSDDLEDLIGKVTNTFDNTACCTGWMDTTRKTITYMFDSTYICTAIITYTVVRQQNQNVK